MESRMNDIGNGIEKTEISSPPETASGHAKNALLKKYLAKPRVVLDGRPGEEIENAVRFHEFTTGLRKPLAKHVSSPSKRN
jgi:hypothetical protein